MRGLPFSMLNPIPLLPVPDLKGLGLRLELASQWEPEQHWGTLRPLPPAMLQN